MVLNLIYLDDNAINLVLYIVAVSVVVLNIFLDFFSGFNNFVAITGWKSPGVQKFVSLGLTSESCTLDGTDSMNHHGEWSACCDTWIFLAE